MLSIILGCILILIAIALIYVETKYRRSRAPKSDEFIAANTENIYKNLEDLE